MIVEDGTGLTNSDSYVSVAEADAYATARNLTKWNGSNANKEAALISATQFIEATYRFKGSILKLTQSLSWPRTHVWDSDLRTLEGVPRQIKQATIELAIVALTQPLVASPEVAAIKRKKVKAGSVETETEYAVSGGSNVDASPSVFAERILSDLIKSGSSSGLGGSFAAFVPG